MHTYITAVNSFNINSSGGVIDASVPPTWQITRNIVGNTPAELRTNVLRLLDTLEGSLKPALDLNIRILIIARENTKYIVLNLADDEPIINIDNSVFARISYNAIGLSPRQLTRMRILNNLNNKNKQCKI